MSLNRIVLIAALVSLPLSRAVADAEACRAALTQLQARLERERIVDAGGDTVPGFPHLGQSRWLAQQQRLADTPAKQSQWLRLAADRAWRDWQIKLRRLLPARRPDELLLNHCLPRLVATTDFDQVPRLQIPDSYHTWQRVLGLYPVTQWLARPFVGDYRRSMTARFHTATAPRHYYQLADGDTSPPVPRQLANNPLQIPLPDKRQQRALLRHYAPVLGVANAQRWNRPGAITLELGDPHVDPSQPTAYTWLSWARFDGHNLLQLNYQFWFSQRPPDGALDLYAGKLDGLIWRVTLAPDGRVLFYDSVHPCGCYHKVYPVHPHLRPADIKGDKPVYYPEPVPDAKRQRLALWLEADTHYVVRVQPVRRVAPAEPYQLAPASRLRALPDGRGGYASVFDHRGLVPESRRLERWLLWPMGVPSAGAMRQRGQHAIAFIGRRHFDDPDLPSRLFAPVSDDVLAGYR